MFKLLCLLVAYIIVSSTAIGYFVYESENRQLSSLQNIDYKGDLIRLDGSIPLNMFIDSSLSTNNLEFVNVDEYGELLKISPSYTALNKFDAIKSTVYIRGIESENNVYTVKYTLYNPNSIDFSIISGITDLNWFTGNKKVILSKFEGLTNNARFSLSFVEDTSLGYALNSPLYVNNNIGAYWNSDGLNDVTSIFDKNSNTVSIYLNDNLICSNIPIETNDEFYEYGGIRLEQDGIIYLQTIESKVYLTDDNENNQNLLFIIAQLLTWNVEEIYLPSILNVILIKIPLLCLSIAVALAIFGVS